MSTTERAAGSVGNFLDERVGASKGVKFLFRKIFPDHWSFMLGEVALYSFIILLLTGTFLTFFYVPSVARTTYTGTYAPLGNQTVSEAYASTLRLSFDVRGGLLMRQIHHWSALIFVAATVVHMFRIFFTGAFRKPRELNWVIGVDARAAGDRRGLRRLLAAGRPALRHGPADRVEHHPGDSRGRLLPELLRLRRPVPR